MAKEHLAGLVELKGEHVGVREFRGQSTFYIKGIPRAARTKAALVEAETQQEMIDIFDRFLEEYKSGRHSKRCIVLNARQKLRRKTSVTRTGSNARSSRKDG